MPEMAKAAHGCCQELIDAEVYVIAFSPGTREGQSGTRG
ncbi:MAG: hypothetical protein QOK30_89 [Nocardioidaceae bacterium]|jgi:hypothetical protein|nr:hypothetical protein [Nocardioidaceae bacterium]